MPLQGTFDVLNFSEVLRLLATQQLTGRLHVRSRSFGANLYFDEGCLVGADQSEHQAAAAAGDVRGRLEEICFEMLDAERGGFEFQPGRPSTLPTPTRLPVDTVLTRARTRLQEWQELQELIPSLDLQPRLVDDLASTEVTIDQERWRMLTVIDGRRSLRAIGRTLNVSDFDVCRVVRSLLEDGIAQLDQRSAALVTAGRDAASPAPAPVASPVIHTARATDGGNAGHAGDLASQTKLPAAAEAADAELAADPELTADTDAAADKDAAAHTGDAHTGDAHTEDAHTGDGDAEGDGGPASSAPSAWFDDLARDPTDDPGAPIGSELSEPGATEDGAREAEGGPGPRRRVVRIRSRTARPHTG